MTLLHGTAAPTLPKNKACIFQGKQQPCLPDLPLLGEALTAPHSAAFLRAWDDRRRGDEAKAVCVQAHCPLLNAGGWRRTGVLPKPSPKSSGSGGGICCILGTTFSKRRGSTAQAPSHRGGTTAGWSISLQILTQNMMEAALASVN